MPAYKKTSKYSEEDNQRLHVTLMMVLDEAERALSTAEIQNSDISLKNFTTQKISRELNELSEMGIVKKLKPKGSSVFKYMTMENFEESIK